MAVMCPRDFHRDAAFTLIEMIVIVAIIALLLAMLLPNLQHAKELGRRTVCAANSRSQVQACDAYAVENTDHFPPSQGPGGVNWAYSFDLKSSSGGTHIPMGVGLAVAHGYLVMDPSAFHCPSMNTANATKWNTPYHSMDVTIPNWWNSVGASGWDEPAHAGKRITIAYSYRGPSWWRTNPASPQIRTSKMDGSFVVNVDIMDPRFGKWYTHKDGFNFTRIDQSGQWFPETTDEFEQAAIAGAVVVDGVNQPWLDEILFRKLEEGP